MGLGGFSSHDASFGHWNSPLIEGITVVFMLIAGMNFATLFLAVRGRSLLPYAHDPEARYFLGVTLARGEDVDIARSKARAAAAAITIELK